MTDRVTANLPSRDFGATAAFCARLGFAVGYREDTSMILGRGPREIAFLPHPERDPAASWHSACLRATDLDAPRAAWSAAGLPAAPDARPRITGIARLAPGLRMVAVGDGDGSLLRGLGR